MTNRVLLVDDDPDDLELIQEVLKEYHQGYTFEAAHNGREALDHLLKLKELPCLIVLDINMPIMDGKQTLEVIKDTERLKTIPVIVFTTSSSELDRMFCNRHGVEMITKPTSMKELKRALCNVLRPSL